jgi:hypothetical protein
MGGAICTGANANSVIGREVFTVDSHDIVRAGSAFNSRFCAFSRQISLSTPVGRPEDNPTGEQVFAKDIWLSPAKILVV